MPIESAPSPSNSVPALNGEECARLAGSALLITVRDRSQLPKRVATLRLRRSDRVPLFRKVLLDHDGQGRFRGWTPFGLDEIAVDSPSSDAAASLDVAAIPLWHVALLITLKSPWAMLQTCSLLLAGNMRGFRYRFARLYESLNEPAYDDWLELAEADIAGLVTAISAEAPAVLVSILGDEKKVEETRRSLARQTYRNVRQIDPRLISSSFNRDRTFWIRIPAGDQLHERAIELLLQPLVQDPRLAGAYGDEDRIGPRERRRAPFFKPAWNPPLAQTGWLAPDAALMRLSALPPDLDLEKASAGQLLLAASKAGGIAHLPRVLLHRRQPAEPARPSAPKSPAAATRVSVVIPTRDRADLLRACLHGLLDNTRYDELDIVVVDNESREAETFQLFEHHERLGQIRRIRLPGGFNFSRACNLGVAHARHDLVLLLNNDVEPLDPDWLDQLVAELDDPDIGAAGAMLLFPDGFVQHAGVTLGSGSVARHSFQFRKPGAGEDRGLLEQRQEVSAVTAACLLTRRELWQAVGGMNEDQLAVAFNDVDYCLKLREIGKGVMWTPHARLLHRESVSRGRDDTPEKLARFASEEAYMYRRWGQILQNDPFYNPNLSLLVGDRCLDVQPRDLSPRAARVAQPMRDRSNDSLNEKRPAE